MFIRSFLYSLIFCGLTITFTVCNRKSDNKEQLSPRRSEFSWKEELKSEDIPDFSVKGFLNGQEVKFDYVNLERWHGSNDNVINLSLSKPEQPCGYIENFTGFRIIRKGKEIGLSEFSKPNFSSAADSYEAEYYYSSPEGGHSFDARWNCFLVIENYSDKEAIGKLALCFSDPMQSWVAGKFIAKICNN